MKELAGRHAIEGRHWTRAGYVAAVCLSNASLACASGYQVRLQTEATPAVNTALVAEIGSVAISHGFVPLFIASRLKDSRLVSSYRKQFSARPVYEINLMVYYPAAESDHQGLTLVIETPFDTGKPEYKVEVDALADELNGVIERYVGAERTLIERRRWGLHLG